MPSPSLVTNSGIGLSFLDFPPLDQLSNSNKKQKQNYAFDKVWDVLVNEKRGAFPLQKEAIVAGWNAPLEGNHKENVIWERGECSDVGKKQNYEFDSDSLNNNEEENFHNTHDLDECFCKMCDNLRDKVEGKKRAKTKIQTSKFIGINRKINCCSTKPLKSKRSKKVN